MVALEPLGKGILATTLRYDYEMRDEHQFFKDIATPKVSKDMLQLAGHILDTKAAHFDAGKFKDQYEIALRKLVERKAAGKKIEPAAPPARPDNVINLMDALRQSLGGKSRGAATHARGRASTRLAPRHAARSRKRKAA
jgi:DNA end-binding protein Ku